MTREMLLAQGQNPDDDPRLRLMQAHREDPLRQVDLSEFPKNRHLARRDGPVRTRLRRREIFRQD